MKTLLKILVITVAIFFSLAMKPQQNETVFVEPSDQETTVSIEGINFEKVFR